MRIQLSITYIVSGDSGQYNNLQDFFLLFLGGGKLSDQNILDILYEKLSKIVEDRLMHLKFDERKNI